MSTYPEEAAGIALSTDGSIAGGTADAHLLFQPFSAQRLFTALGSNITDVTFFVPGTSVPAFVTGFGSVFTDIDRFGSTTLQFFHPGNKSLGRSSPGGDRPK